MTVSKPPEIIKPKSEINKEPEIPKIEPPKIIMPSPIKDNSPQTQPKIEPPKIINPNPKLENEPKKSSEENKKQQPEIPQKTIINNPLQIKPPNIQPKEEPKKEEPKKMNPIKQIKPNDKFSAMQNMLANKIGQKGGMMMMGAPQKKEEEKIDHDENIRGTGESNYEAVIVKTTNVVKKKKPKRTNAFGGGTAIPAKTVTKKIENKPKKEVTTKPSNAQKSNEKNKVEQKVFKV